MALKEELGIFCWYSLMTKDEAKANAFYPKLFGLEVSEMEIPGMGKSTMYAAQGTMFGGPVPLGEAGAQIPSHWISYITVENVDEACKKVTSLGGKICYEPFDMPSIGRTAIVEDPAGTVFHLFAPARPEETMTVMGKGQGQVCWMELMLDDPEKVLPFYKELFAWEVSPPMEMNGGLYYSIKINGEAQGGFMKRPPEVPPMPAAWMPYFAVESVDAFNKKAEELGGRIILGKTHIPETGYFSCIEGPTGAHFYLFEWSA